jgi:hypothetical protein
MVYYSIAHSVMSYDIIFWDGSTHSKTIFRIQKRIIRIITDCGSRVSFQNLFKKLSILPFQPQYIFSLLMFVLKNKDFFKFNSDFHTFITRSKCDLHFPVVNLTVRQKGVCCVGIKLYNCLPITLKQILHDTPKFKVALKSFLAINSFYTVEEYYCHK